ncbi:MAG: hypothetical protein ACKOBY_06010, partial [Cyanobium sp.]
MTDPASSTAPPHPKEALRRRFRQLRRASLPAAAVGLLEVAQRELPALIPPGRRLGLWWPIGAEPDLRPLAVELQHRRPDALALPVVEPWPPGGSHLQLHYRPWIPGALLLPGTGGVAGDPLLQGVQIQGRGTCSCDPGKSCAPARSSAASFTSLQPFQQERPGVG